MRKHGDIDISVYWRDRDAVISYMQNLGWEIYEMCGNSIVHKISDICVQYKIKRNIFCFSDGCKLVNLQSLPEDDMFLLEFDHRGQTEFNFLEFLFNNTVNNEFVYARDETISLPINKAVLYRHDIPYLAPELVLLYKSTDIEREGYQKDFDETFNVINSQQKTWLNNALFITNPAGHPWIKG